MNKFVLAVVFALALFAIAEGAPRTPIWPAEFSASMFITANTPQFPQPVFLRWFSSQSANAERLDGLQEFSGQFFFANRYILHNTALEYEVFYQGDTVTCFTHPVSFPLPDPNFSQFSYVGTGLINYVPTWIWSYDNTNGSMLYYETSTGGEPVRFDYNDAANGVTFTYDFFEFDAGTQDPTIFQVPSAINSICNSAPKM